MKTNLFKKSLSALLALILVLGALAALPVSVAAETTAWDGETTAKPNGSGTTADPYLVGTGAELAWLSANVGTLFTIDGNVNIKLTADIDLGGKEFTPISLRAGTEEYTYKGVVLDGQNKTIRGLTVTGADNAALFAFAGANSSIKDLTVSGAKVSASAAGAASALVATAYGSLTIEKVQTDATSQVTGRKAGGFVGYVLSSNAMLTVNKCVNRAAVTGVADGSSASMVGGLVGWSEGGNSVTMTFCVNEGTVTHVGNTAKNQGAGGILGAAVYKAGNTDVVRMEDCYNVGNLVATGGEGTCFGGMSGRIQTSKIYWTRCFDYSNRDFDGGVSHNRAMAGWGAKAESIKYYTDMYACNGADSKSPYDAIHGYAALASNDNYVNVSNTGSSNIKASLLQVIVLQDGTGTRNSTMLAEMTRIAEAAGTTAPTPVVAGSDGMARDYSWYAAADGTLTDKGTEAAPYELSNAAQWAAFSSLSNGMHDTTAVAIAGEAVNFNGKYFKLTGDIDLTGYRCDPVAALGFVNTIVFDGAGHTISNLTQNSGASGGLFGQLGDKSVIKNLNITKLNTDVGGTVGGFVAVADSGIAFSNCKITDSTLKGKTSSGGFIGTQMSNKENPEISFVACVNDADVTVMAGGTQYVGGFIGLGTAVPNLQVTFDYCVNKGDISISSTSGTAVVGGFIGRIAYDFSKSDSVLVIAENCYNVGALSATVKDSETSVYMGGFFGHAHIGGELSLTWVHDYSVRAVENGKQTNGALVGNSANVELIKILTECFGANNPESEAVYSAIYAATRNASTLKDKTCAVVEELGDAVTMNGTASTLEAELARIDAVLASVDPVTGDFDDPTEDLEKPAPTPSTPSTSTPSNEETDKEEDKKDDATTTKAADDETDAPAEEGCGSSVSATFAVLALTAACGMAIVGKKKED